MKYLITRTDQFRCDTEEEVNAFLEQLKKDKNFDIVSTTITQKEKKKSGEVVDSWIKLVVKKKYNDEAEPIVTYHPEFMYGEEDFTNE